MAINYNPTKWENGKTILKASHFEKIEKGITDIINYNNSIYADEDIRKENEIKREEEHNKKIKEVTTLVDDLKSDYDALEKIIIDENASANLQNQINDVTSQLAHITYDTTALNGDVDETNVLANIFNSVENGQRLLFDKKTEIKISGTAKVSLNNKHNVTISGLRIDGTSSENVISIRGGSSNITFKDCYFANGTQIILLFDCENIIIDNCVFDSTGYGIIQQMGYTSNNVKIINCTAINMRQDFVECNCEVDSPSKNWIISNNHYLGGFGYPTVKTEARFIGVTMVENVIISNNIVENVCGDSIVHLEDASGKVIIQSNVFKNSRGYGYIYTMGGQKDININGNIFINDEVDNLTPFIFSASGDYFAPMLINNNEFYGHEELVDLFKISDNVSNVKIISNNYIKGFKRMINPRRVNNVQFINNYVEGNEGIIFENQSGGTLSTWLISNNTFKTSGRSIIVDINTNGTSPPNNIIIHGNDFYGDCIVRDVKNSMCYGNTISSSKTLKMEKRYFGNNVVFSYGNIVRDVGINPNDNIKFTIS